MMSEQFWVGDDYVDASRNQITRNGETHSLPPKVMSVLVYLAIHRDRVVSQDELLTQVWKETIVSPNTIQRCIAQLRKALGETSKSQTIIRTHSKKGYSLECEVTWADTPGTAREPEPVESETKNRAREKPAQRFTGATFRRIVAGILATLTVFVISAFYLHDENQPSFTITSIRPVTSTDNRELASIYSPDGNFVVFKRFTEQLCVNTLWAKDLNTQEEFLLTSKEGIYDSVTFTEDGKKLVFISQQNCAATDQNAQCYYLQSLDFSLALTSPQSADTLMECENSEIRSARWIGNNSIALMQKQHKRWRLISYSLTQDQVMTLHAPGSGNLIDFDYSSSSDRIALISIHSDNRYYIEKLSPDGQVITSNPISYPPEIAPYRPIYPNFTLSGESLIFSTGTQLFSLNFNGMVSKVDVVLDEAMGTPVFHPDGRRMLTIKGHYDSDILAVTFTEYDSRSPLTDTLLPEGVVIARSIYEEANAALQPDGDITAFVSDRTGEAQIWLQDGEKVRQLSQFPPDTFINGFVWSSDGQHILVSASNELRKLDLNGLLEVVELTNPVMNLFHWDAISDTIVALISIQGVATLAEMDLTTTSIRVISEKPIRWAQKSVAGTVVYLDNQYRFWASDSAEDKPLPILDEQGSDKLFIAHDNVLYGINKYFQLWAFDMTTNRLNVLGRLPETVDAITDASAARVLLTKRIAARKDVIELTYH